MIADARIRRWLERLALPFAAGFVLLGFSFVNFLNHHSYPLLRVEVGYFAAAIALLSAVIAVVYAGRRKFGRAFIEALLVAIFVDLNLSSLWLTAAAFIMVFAFVLWKRQSVLPFVAVAAFFMLLTGLAGVGRDRDWIDTTTKTEPASGVAPSQSQRPAILHLILDEHGGLEGFPNRHSAADEMKADLRKFYESRGFAMFGRAHSEHHETANSIPHMINFGQPVAAAENPMAFVKVRPNRYLASLRKQGYRLRLYQNDYVDFCEAAAPEACTTFYSASAGALLETSLDRTDRAQLLLFKFLALSDVLKELDRISTSPLEYVLGIQKLAPPLQRLGYTGSVASLLMMDRLANDLEGARPGEVYFAHLLLPHFPWVAESDCTLRPLKDWDREIVIEPLAARELAYFDQVRCTTNKIDLLLRSLARSPAGKESVVVIHGDHGSRITELVPNVVNHAYNSREDLIAGFSTLFVVKSPYFGGAYLERPASVADLLHQLSESEFRKLPTEGNGTPTVYLSDRDWRPRRRVALPPDW